MTRFKYGAVLGLLMLVLSVSLVVTRPVPTPASAAPASLTLTFTCAQAVDYQSGKVCVHTHAGASLTIKVKYCSGYYANSKSLKGTRTADSAGNYTWHWVPETSCRGTATATVSDTWNGQTISRSKTFTVQ